MISCIKTNCYSLELHDYDKLKKKTTHLHYQMVKYKMLVKVFFNIWLDCWQVEKNSFLNKFVLQSNVMKWSSRGGLGKSACFIRSMTLRRWINPRLGHGTIYMYANPCFRGFKSCDKRRCSVYQNIEETKKWYQMIVFNILYANTEISMMLGISEYMDLFLWNLPTTNGW